MGAMKICPIRNFVPLKSNLSKENNSTKPLAFKNNAKMLLNQKENFGFSNYVFVSSIVPFCARKRVTADDVKQEARKVCSCCHYGKADILENPDRLKIKKDGEKFFLDGYYTENDGKTMTGVCEELAHKVGTILGEKFKDDYTPLVFSFSGTKYDFDEHVCIVMIKRSAKNDAQIEGIRNLNYDENLRDIEDYDGGVLFDGALFIDPSFNVVCDIEKIPASYGAIVSFNTLEKNNPYNEPKEIVPGSNNYLGYIKDICPELQAIDFPPKAMVSFVVPKEKPGKLFKKRLLFRIYLPENKRYIVGDLKDLKKALPKSKFTAFMTKIENELIESEKR